ncbi:MAG: hypothetical protein HY255_03185 [Betaproteobacteria bacterium]|nr:hypothetical protein [Betaproteobacteria bacterium]
MTGEMDATLAELRVLTERVRTQIDAAHSEIGETRAILRDAIERLIPAFTGQRAQSADMHLAIHEAAFSALQFQDISDQQLAHAHARLVALRTQFDCILTTFGNGTTSTATQQQLLALVKNANEQLAKLDVSHVKPVAKPHLGTGDMEIFQ